MMSRLAGDPARRRLICSQFNSSHGALCSLHLSLLVLLFYLLWWESLV